MEGRRNCITCALFPAGTSKDACVNAGSVYWLVTVKKVSHNRGEREGGSQNLVSFSHLEDCIIM